MVTSVKYPIVVICVFIWIGFICAISFMEAWLKFQAPGVTLALGLGIGKLVFAALNKIELVLGSVIFIILLLNKEHFFRVPTIFFLIVACSLLLQTIWLLPALSDRARMIIEGINVSPSNLHFYYVALECVKLISLFGFGIKQFR